MKEGWNIRNFEKCLVKVPKQKSIKSKNYLQFGSFPIISQESIIVSGYSNDETLLYKHNKPVVIFGDHTKNIKYIDFDFIVGADGVHILLTKDDILPKFFYYELCSINIRNLGYARHYKLLKEKNIMYPTSLSDQQRIVSYLDAEFAKIEALKANAEKQLQAAKDLFQAALKELLTPKEGWVEKKLGDLSLYYNGLTYKPSDVSKQGFLVLRSSNIQNNKLSLEDQVRVSVVVNDKLKIHKGDIIMCSRNGSKALIGKVAIIPEEYEDLTFGTFMMVIKSKFNPFLYYFFLSERFKGQIWKGEANMINQITRYMLDDVFVCLPTNIDEQHRIVARLDALSANVKALQTNYTETITLCNDLKQALLKKVFE